MANRIIILLTALLLCVEHMLAQFGVDYKVSAMGNASTDDNFAPYYISSNNHGMPTQSGSGYLSVAASHAMDTTRRFSFGFGADIIGGYASASDYEFYDATSKSWASHALRPASFWIQQLYGEIKYRGVFLSVGMKEYNSAFLNQELSSGDFTFSGNTRPVPEVRVGFVNFQNIPFTNGWVQIQGEYSFGKNMDSDWMNDHYNYYNNTITTGTYYNYKRMFFRTKPTLPFVLTVGLQAAMQLGGTTRRYVNGVKTQEYKEHIDWEVLGQTLIPGSGDTSGNENFVTGNSVGSWDIIGAYKFRSGDELKAYMQIPWEDGSGLGKLNGWDGIYGIEYKSAGKGIVSGAVIEYLHFMNHSGPIHFAPDDYSDKQGHFPNQATGADDYYNNFQYSGYQYYGMSIGTPFIKSPIYNSDGYLLFADNRIQGFHVGMTGYVSKNLSYRLLASYRTSLGSSFVPRTERVHNTSAMLETTYDFVRVPGLQAKCQIAFDAGKLYGDNFGALLSISYSGKLNF